jgi:hypothetical protein
MTHGTSPWRSNIDIVDNISIRSMLRKGRKEVMVCHKAVGLRHNRQNMVNGGFIPIASEPLPSYLFIPSCHAPRIFFLFENLSPQTKPSLYSNCYALALYLTTVSKLFSKPAIVNPECVCPTN